MVDFGYDVSNFSGIDLVFGTMATFDALVDKLHSRGKAVFTLVLCIFYKPCSNDRLNRFTQEKLR